MGKAQQIKRVPVGVSVRPELKDRLAKESEARFFGEGKLVEDALEMLFAHLDKLEDEAVVAKL